MLRRRSLVKILGSFMTAVATLSYTLTVGIQTVERNTSYATGLVDTPHW